MRFYEVEGGVDTVYSRLLSLRRELWVQGDDNITQMIGFKLGTSFGICEHFPQRNYLSPGVNVFIMLFFIYHIDIIMSTGYECALSSE